MEEDPSLYTLRQQKILTFLPIVPGILSVVGSLCIILDVCKDYKLKLKRVYYRLILAICILDVISTAGSAVIMNGWAIPRGTKNVYGARGTVTTCNIAGFLFHLGIGMGLYAAFLSLYFLLVIRYGKKDQWITCCIEPIMHILSSGVVIVSGIIAWYKEYFNPMEYLQGWCWFRDFPYNCSKSDQVPCVRGENYFGFARLITPGFSSLMYLLVIVDMVLIFCTVRDQERKISRYRLRASPSQRRNMNSNHGLIGQCASRTKEIRIQALLYIGAFFLTWGGPAIWNALYTSMDPLENKHVFFILAVFIKIFHPLFGFWNALIYFQTMSCLSRKIYKHQSDLSLEPSRNRDERNQSRSEITPLDLVPDGQVQANGETKSEEI